MEKMKQDVRAAREKNGVYIPHERFVQEEAQKKEMSDKICQLELELDLKRKEADKYKELYHAEQERNLDVESELKECKTSLENNKKAFLDFQEVQVKSNMMLKEKEFIISNLLQSEHAILERAKEIRSSLENASEDVTFLLTKIERQAKIETGNKGLIMTFGSQLDQSLKVLHKTVVGSVCEQHQLLRSLEEHVRSFIANKCEVASCLESRIEKIKDIYTSGVLGMKGLAVSLQGKAISDLEQMNCTIFSQIMTVENFLATAVSEAEQVLDDLQISIAEQKELLAFSAQQQEEGLQRSLVSTQAISKTTLDFFNDLQSQASRLITVLEENQMEMSCQLDDFESKFKELSAKEERIALERIAGILTNLTATKSNLVTEAVRSMNDTSLHEKKRLQEEMSSIQLVSDKAKNEWNTYIEKVERQFQENVSSVSNARVTMENNLHCCSEKVGQSTGHLENAKLSVEQLNKDCATEIESSIQMRNQDTINLVEKLVSTSSLTDVKFQTATCDMLTIVIDALTVDNEATREIGSISTMCSNHLQALQGDHTESIKDIRNLTERCLLKEYTVDHSTTTTPVKKEIEVPTLASIEALRTPSLADLVKEMPSENRLKGCAVGGKQPFSPPSQIPRNPLTPINLG